MSGQNLVDAYMPSYYTPYLQYPPTQPGRPMGLEASWSAAPEQVSYMPGGYNYSSMYSPFDYPGYGWYPGGAEYGEWGNGGEGGYYTMAGGAESYEAPSNGDVDNGGVEADGGVKGVEHSMRNMGLGDSRDVSGHHHEDDGGYSSRSLRVTSGSGVVSAKKPTSWAGIASQPANQPKNQLIPRAPLQPGRGGVNNMDIGSWDGKNNRQGGVMSGGGHARPSASGVPLGGRGGAGSGRPNAGGPYRSETASRDADSTSGGSSIRAPQPSSAPVDKLMDPALYNPKEFDLSAKGARFFIIKSYSEDDIHRSIKYSIWCSTDYGNKRLDAAFQEREGKGVVYLLYSVNGSGHFCGMAQMLTPVDYHAQSSVWVQDKWKGQFKVKWIYVKDVPNSQLRHIKLENNEGKPVTNSRDTQEVLGEKGPQVLRIIHQYRHTTSIFDDFGHYEKRQEEDGPKV